jgi:hypothetical protein
MSLGASSAAVVADGGRERAEASARESSHPIHGLHTAQYPLELVLQGPVSEVTEQGPETQLILVNVHGLGL